MAGISNLGFCEVFADLRAAGTPDRGGAMPTIVILGKTAINDGLGGVFYWSGASTATADDNTIQVTGVSTGRWLRVTTV